MTALTERLPRTQDVEALIDVLAMLKAGIRGQQCGTIELDVDQPRDRLAGVGLLGSDADVSETAPGPGRMSGMTRPSSLWQ
jgi:hypothetical protein